MREIFGGFIGASFLNKKAKSLKLASKSALGLFALLMTVNAHAVDYPSTIDNTR